MSGWKQVVYFDVAGHIQELYVGVGGAWAHADLTEITGAPAAASNSTLWGYQSLRSRGVLAVGSGDGNLPDLPPARHHARWFRPPRPSALRLPSLSSGLHPRFQRRLLGLPLAA